MRPYTAGAEGVGAVELYPLEMRDRLVASGRDVRVLHMVRHAQVRSSYFLHKRSHALGTIFEKITASVAHFCDDNSTCRHQIQPSFPQPVCRLVAKAISINDIVAQHWYSTCSDAVGTLFFQRIITFRLTLSINPAQYPPPPPRPHRVVYVYLKQTN